MEKHNIDQLFNERLQNYERKPRPEAWDKLQAKLQQNETKIVPLWWKVARAASVVLLLGAVGYWTINTDKQQDVTVANNKVSLQKTTNKSQNTQLQSQLTEPKGVSTEIVAHQESLKKNLSISQTPKARVHQVPQNPLIEQRQEISELVVAKVDPIQSVPQTNNTIVLVVEPGVEPVSPVKTTETIVLAMVDAMDTGGTERPRPSVWAEELNTKKTTKFGKLWQQIKRVKNGEGVDWNELGVKPQKVLARADARLENTRETIVESVREIKNNEK